MYQTTYAVEFQPPHLREENFICRTHKKLGKKHFPDVAAVKSLGKRLTYVEHGPGLIDACECEPKTEKEEESDAEAANETGEAGDGKRRYCSSKMPEFLYHIEWTPLNIMGRILTPKLIPTKMTPEQEKLLAEMMEETEKICMSSEEDANAEDAKPGETGDISSNDPNFKVIEGFTPQPIYVKYVADECRKYCRH